MEFISWNTLHPFTLKKKITRKPDGHEVEGDYRQKKKEEEVDQQKSREKTITVRHIAVLWDVMVHESVIQLIQQGDAKTCQLSLTACGRIKVALIHSLIIPH